MYLAHFKKQSIWRWATQGRPGLWRGGLALGLAVAVVGLPVSASLADSFYVNARGSAHDVFLGGPKPFRYVQSCPDIGVWLDERVIQHREWGGKCERYRDRRYGSTEWIR